ncbi:MAG: hypothetical protein KDJ38_10440 [Gammaproteobacteria bacterium]|nr:hypothetical protein [Gammaproteobacteria bacterium]
MHNLTTSHKVLGFALLLFVLLSGYLLIQHSRQLELPDNAMVVELLNYRQTPIDLVEIKHGNNNTQETIVALQIQPGETRPLVINHQPGLGFNLTMVADGEKTEVCVGKTSQSRRVREIFYDDDSIEEVDLQ